MLHLKAVADLTVQPPKGICILAADWYAAKGFDKAESHVDSGGNGQVCMIEDSIPIRSPPQTCPEKCL